MSSSLRRGALAATVAFTILPLTAACGAGFDAETTLVQPVNATTQVEDIKIQSINVVMSEDGPAAVTGRIFNEGSEPRTLVSITLPENGEVFELVPAEGESTVEIPAGGSVGLGGEGNAGAFVTDAESVGIVLGNAQHLVFDLSEVGTAELRATVVPMVGVDGAFAHYELWGPDGVAGTEDDAVEGEEPGTEDEQDTDGPEDSGSQSPGETDGSEEQDQDSDGQSPGESNVDAEDGEGTGTDSGTDG
ncbi:MULTISPECIES: DUF461 domain-containing protein [Streptomyces]|uniref:DUF461 domain-containing protein n=1 Tax=Streptomyces TaxID=1883 RepID=UPI000CD53C73|nr:MULTISPECIES: DUF461 domain-containing protein [Streptomyces]